jgi:CRISPR-associated protein Cas1
MTTELLSTLYVQTQGASLHLDGEAIRVILPEEPGRRVLPLRRYDALVIYGHVSVSADLIAHCARDGRPITWMSPTGRFVGRLDGAQRGNVLLRHAQHQAHADPAARLAIARPIVAGKLQNTRHVLVRAARDADGQRQVALRQAAADIAGMIPPTATAATLDELMGAEGNATRRYFSVFGHLVSGQSDLPPLTGRTRRPPTDPLNALLSFAYGLLRGLVHGACEVVGLDPYLGFLHGLRPARPALVLDLMEEFRAPVADRFALSLVNRRQVTSRDFDTLPGGAVSLSEDGRKTVLTAWQDWRSEDRQHTLLGRSIPHGLLPVVQARLLARHLRGELPGYIPWTARWWTSSSLTTSTPPAPTASGASAASPSSARDTASASRSPSSRSSSTSLASSGSSTGPTGSSTLRWTASASTACPPGDSMTSRRLARPW